MKVGSKKNNAWGNSLIWACIQAIYNRYGDGHYATVATHKEHLLNFAKWLKSQGINDIMCLTREDLLNYAKYVQKSYSNNYARNLISSANIIVECVRQDRNVRLNPSEVLEKRQSVRKSTPAGLEVEKVQQAAEALIQNGQKEVGILILLIRHFGMRLKEGCLLDLRVALRLARKRGEIDVRRGTKGGRGKRVERWVPASEQAIEILIQAQALCTKKSPNLIPEDISSIKFMRRVKREWRKVREKYELCKIHDLRAAYACDRYRKITGHDAPACNHGKMTASKDQDRGARDVIVKEIGHGSRGRMGPYTGRGAR